MAQETAKIVDARRRRAYRLADAFLEWQKLAERGEYPTALVEIAESALKREYALGQKRGPR